MSKKSEGKAFVGLDADGFEHPDPTPVEIPTRLRIPQRQVDRIRDIIRRELSVSAQSEGWESFDEADDFELEGEDPISAYEEVFEPLASEAEGSGVSKSRHSPIAKQKDLAQSRGDEKSAGDKPESPPAEGKESDTAT